jgi:hypothetical protein
MDPQSITPILLAAEKVRLVRKRSSNTNPASFKIISKGPIVSMPAIAPLSAKMNALKTMLFGSKDLVEKNRILDPDSKTNFMYKGDVMKTYGIDIWGENNFMIDQGLIKVNYKSSPSLLGNYPKGAQNEPARTVDPTLSPPDRQTNRSFVL